MIDYDSFSRCHLTDIFFSFSRGSKRVKVSLQLDESIDVSLCSQLLVFVGYVKEKNGGKIFIL